MTYETPEPNLDTKLAVKNQIFNYYKNNVHIDVFEHDIEHVRSFRTILDGAWFMVFIVAPKGGDSFFVKTTGSPKRGDLKIRTFKEVSAVQHNTVHQFEVILPVWEEKLLNDIEK